MEEHKELILDGTKINWHLERVQAWERGERIAPITIDMALTRACNYSCHFCYAMFQENDRKKITKEVIFNFLEDCAEIGVKGISFVSDGESTISPVFIDACKKGHELGISMAVGTNAFVLTKNRLEELLPYLTYLRVNFSAGERKRYAEIMGVKESAFDRVCQNIRDMMEIKKRDNLSVTVGMQMVLMPEDGDQIIPLAKLGKELRPDYAIIKHCSDNEDGGLGGDGLGVPNPPPPAARERPELCCEAPRLLDLRGAAANDAPVEASRASLHSKSQTSSASFKGTRVALRGPPQRLHRSRSNASSISKVSGSALKRCLKDFNQCMFYLLGSFP